jgi:hypothetical protein
MVVYLGIFRPGYAINDDIKMISLVAGYPTGTPVPFLVFSNVLLGFLLVPLYGLPTHINWEVLFFILAQFMSVWALLDVVLSSWLKAGHKAFGTTVVLVSEAYFALNITFTTTASFACLAGSCMLISAARRSRNLRLAPILLGSILIVAGGLIRFEMVPIVLSLAVPAAALARKAFVIRRLVVSCLAVGLVVSACYLFDRLYVRASSDWHTYDVYNNTRSLIQDTHRLENLGRSVRRIGWSANDQELFIRWYYPDEQTYSLEKLQFLVTHVSALSSNPGFTMLSILQAPFSPFLLPYLLVICASYLWMYSHAHLGRAILPLVAIGCICVADNFYFGWAWKIADRILLSTLSATAILGFIVPSWLAEQALGHMSGSSETHDRRAWALYASCVALVASAALMLAQSGVTSGEHVIKQDLYQQILADITHLQLNGTIARDALIVSPAHGLPLEWASPWTLQFPTVAYLDMNWLTFSPSYDEALKAHKIEDLPAAMLQRHDVYLMTRENILPYIGRSYEEHEKVTVGFESFYAMPNPNSFAGYEGVHLYEVVPPR